MIELQRCTIVQATRNAFGEAMRGRFIGEIQRPAGRNVMALISNHSVGPEIELELFFLTPDLRAPPPRRQTSRGSAADGSA